MQIIHTLYYVNLYFLEIYYTHDRILNELIISVVMQQILLGFDRDIDNK